MPSTGLTRLTAQLKPALPRVALLAAIWAVLVGLLVGAGELITSSGAVSNWDHQVTRDAVSSRTSALNTAMKIVTWLGSWVALVVAAAIIALLVLSKRLPVLTAAVAVAAWAGEALGVRIAKEAIARNRPPHAIWLVNAQGWSFPSGHAAAAALAFTALAACLTVLARRALVTAAGWMTAGLAVAATAFSRVELGVHWTSDVIASVVFVGCWLTAIALVSRPLPPSRADG